MKTGELSLHPLVKVHMDSFVGEASPAFSIYGPLDYAQRLTDHHDPEEKPTPSWGHMGDDPNSIGYEEIGFSMALLREVALAEGAPDDIVTITGPKIDTTFKFPRGVEIQRWFEGTDRPSSASIQVRRSDLQRYWAYTVSQEIAEALMKLPTAVVSDEVASLVRMLDTVKREVGPNWLAYQQQSEMESKTPIAITTARNKPPRI